MSTIKRGWFWFLIIFIVEQFRVSQRGVQLCHSAMQTQWLRPANTRGRLQAHRPGGRPGYRLLWEPLPGGGLLLRGSARVLHTTDWSSWPEDCTARQCAFLYWQRADGEPETRRETKRIIINPPSFCQANSPAACQRACEIEAEFLCRSYLYLGPPNGAQYNCRSDPMIILSNFIQTITLIFPRLYHLDHWTLPDGPSTFLLNDRPLIDNGGRIGTFYENRCKSKCSLSPRLTLTHCPRVTV